MINYTSKEGAIVFSVKVVPRASKSEINGELDGALKVRIAAPPVDGAANVELIRLLSKTFDVSKSEIEIIGGQTSKLKHLKVLNLSIEKFLSVLQAEI